jgi:NAD(P)H dehydrogenase (quinone)
MKTIAVTGMGGAQGSAIARAFEQQGYEVRRITQEQINHPTSLIEALKQIDLLAITSPVDHRPGTREAQIAALIRAAEQARVGKIVLNTAAAVLNHSEQPVAANLRKIRHIVLDAKVPAVVVQPTVYLDNLITPWAKPAIVQAGVLAYPAPAEAPIAWLSHQSMADYVVAAAQTGVAGQIYDIGGPANLSGAALCEQLSQAIGKTLRYEQIPFDAFAQGLNQAMGAPAGDDIADYYRHLQQHPNALARSTVSALAQVKPESASAWAQRQHWG